MPAVLRHEPDAAVIDLDLPGVDGFAVASGCDEKAPRCRVLLLSAQSQPRPGPPGLRGAARSGS